MATNNNAMANKRLFLSFSLSESKGIGISIKDAKTKEAIETILTTFLKSSAQ